MPAGGGRAIEVDVDAVVADRQRTDEIHGLVVAVDAHPVLPAAGRQLADLVQHRRARCLDDPVAGPVEAVETEFVQRREQRARAGAIAGREGIQIALRGHRVPHVGAQDAKQRAVRLVRAEQVVDRQVDAFLEDLGAVRAEAEAADIGDVRRRREQADGRVVAEYRRDDGEVVEVSRAVPGVVGDEDVAGRERRNRMPVQEIADTRRHRVDVSRCAGHGLREHAAPGVEHARGQVARLAHRRRECRTDQCLCLLLDDRQQAIPQDLHADTIDGSRFRHRSPPCAASARCCRVRRCAHPRPR